MEICIDDLFCDTNTIHNLDCNDVRELLTSAAYELFFIFDQVMYKQIDGIVMSSHSAQFLPMYFYVILKSSSSKNVPLIFYPKSLIDMLMIFL